MFLLEVYIYKRHAEATKGLLYTSVLDVCHDSSQRKYCCDLKHLRCLTKKVLFFSNFFLAKYLKNNKTNKTLFF